VQRAVRLVAASCLTDPVGEEVLAAWPEPLLAEVEARMIEADPQADIEIDLVCDVCSHSWKSAFDVGEFFWAELQSRAMLLLHDVHVLARAYGWSEPEVLSLSEARRAAYIELVSA
jgi:hypothetical protein